MELYPHILCHINSSVKSTDLDNQNCYAVVRTTGFKYLRKRERESGINEPGRSIIFQIVKDLHFGEENGSKLFLKKRTRRTAYKKG